MTENVSDQETAASFASSKGHDVTRFFPLCFDAYMALSAASSSYSAEVFFMRSDPPTPMLVVTGISLPGLVSSTTRLILSAVA